MAGENVKRVGLAAKVHMSATLYESVLAALPGAEYVQVDEDMTVIRGVKTEAEKEVIRYAYKIADIGMKAAIEAIKPGMTEREVAAEAEYAMRKAGAEGYGIDPMVVSGENMKHIIARTTFRKIEGNEAVCITLAPRYEGYHGALARVILLGDVDETFVKAMEAAIHAQEVCSKELLVGKMGSKIEKMGRDIMTEAGYGPNFMYSGIHSVGVTEFEPPILGPSSTTLLEKDMVVSIDIPMFESEVPGFRVETGYMITDGEPEVLTDVPYIIRK